MKKASIPARAVRIKSYIEMFRDYGMMDDTPSPTAFSLFVYADGDDAGADVPEDAVVLPWGGDIPPEQARHLSDILGAYARDKGWDWMQVGDEK